ncbi:TRAP transporter large permease subunit [Amphritea sp. 2_MG-2023]|jgi:tripartite ATP-independent transporter DctM subunit|uniref:TRAP transporter large permease n=1 Tax=Amphritea TaxID=515417 RepID=UPI001C06542D|nr:MULTISPECIES: TRAP transporter large permease subunit [Amphritea]MBU2966796.1 TRAP transporter large permease subunit [Amphritea atlantica]MDO6420673.1 TRAP transporter large permease subunit [Amphritea sp. 2_MG-2023]MDX2424522.1 TRAP transporter large permease subunit [Amphritea sp.]
MFIEYMLPILMVVCLLIGIFTGYPVAFVLGGLSIIFSLVADVPLPYLGIMGSRIFGGVVENWLYIAIPLFVFMGLMLEKSGVASRLLLTLQRLFGQVRGGLAISVALLGVVMAASTGIVGASVVMLGMLALPVMLKQNYKEEMALGVVAASGTLGILIPPSIMLVLMGSIMQVSVGDLFKAALIPGLMLGVLYVAFILITGWLKPEWMPLADPDDLDTDTTPLPLALLRDLVGPVFLMVAVLGSIMSGIATPTEAAAIGALGAIFLAIFASKLDYVTLRDVCYDTAKSTAMIVFIVVAATAFSLIFKKLGGDYLIMDIVDSIGLGPYGLLLSIMLMIFVLGFFLEWIEISYVVLPLLLPVISLLDFGMSSQATLVWFAILMAINLQTSFLTPPFGYALFYLKGVTDSSVKITTIYRSIIPYVLLQVTGLILCIAFPAIILWLPGLL